MSLNFVMESMDGVAADVAALYTEKDGKFYLTGIDGVSPKSKIDEFRENNIELTNRLAAFEGVDPAKYKEMTGELEELRAKLEKSKIDDEAIEKIVQSRVKKLQEEFSGKIAEKDEMISTQERQIESFVIDGQVKSAAVKHKIRDSAIDDVVLRAKSVYKVKDGKAIGFQDGEVMYDATGTKELGIDDWVKGLVNTAPHLFQDSVTSEIYGKKPGFRGDPSNMSPTQKIQAGLG